MEVRIRGTEVGLVPQARERTLRANLGRTRRIVRPTRWFSPRLAPQNLSIRGNERVKQGANLGHQEGREPQGTHTPKGQFL